MRLIRFWGKERVCANLLKTVCDSYCASEVGNADASSKMNICYVVDPKQKFEFNF